MGTGSDREEMIDVVTATGRHLGVASRAEVHREGHWHQVFHCLIVRPGSPARVVLQRRHRNKAAFGGLLDLSATGHLDAGETPLDGIRELTEELGVEVDRNELVPAGVRLLADEDGEGVNRERVHLFYLTDGRPLDAYSPAVDEVEGLVEASAADLLTLVGPPTDVRPDPIDALAWQPGGDIDAVTIGRDDLVNPVDGYWAVLLLMAERFAAGLRPLAI